MICLHRIVGLLDTFDHPNLWIMWRYWKCYNFGPNHTRHIVLLDIVLQIRKSTLGRLISGLECCFWLLLRRLEDFDSHNFESALPDFLRGRINLALPRSEWQLKMRFRFGLTAFGMATLKWNSWKFLQLIVFYHRIKTDSFNSCWKVDKFILAKQ